ncbi:uncharacterized protein LOC131619091 [Vicia villosa]|uniref:uncharacterized protein LOC131619091 n=1 Tax=Vicia villosa TaxID=3911 RepID=UPI00273B9E0B|nr:uncharacterized protein LOC131619091 [Vicia villosa]
MNYAQGNPYSNTYNPGWKNHSNFSYKNNNMLYAPQTPPGFQKPNQTAPQAAPQAPRKSNLEIIMENFVATQTQQNKKFMNQNIHTSELVKQLATKVDALATHNKMLETQISQVAQQQATTAAPAGVFPGQPQPNPKGHANALTLQSGTEYDGPIDPRIQNKPMSQQKDKETDEAQSNDEVDKPTEPETIARDEAEKAKPYVPPPPYKPPIPFPQRLAKSKTEGQFKKFVELLKQLNITIPFTEAITQMPSYAKFLKEILSNKKKLEDNETVMLTAECSAIIQNNMPPKLKDPGSFSIPCVIGKFVIDKTLCDLGASVSLMPLSICMLENIPVRIGQFYIPTDFIIMDIQEDSNIPIILGRPFLATTGATIDVKRGKLTFEVGEEKIEFILSQFLKAPSIVDTCCFVDIIDECVKEIKSEPHEETEILRIPIPPILEDDNWRGEYQDNHLS